MSGLFAKSQAALRNFFGNSAAESNGTTVAVKYLVGKLSELEDGQMKEVLLQEVLLPTATTTTFIQKKILLSKINGHYYATTHLCPHYKARLVTGTITSDGRITW